MRSVRVLKNVVTNYLRFVLSGVIGFVITPIMVRGLGDRDYGLWVTVFSLTGYFGLFDQGLRPSLVRYLSRDHARGDEDGLSRTVNTALALFGGVGGLVLVASVVVAANFSAWFRVDPARSAEMAQVVLVAGASVAVGFPFGVYGAVLSGLQRYDIGNGIGVLVALLRAVAFVVVLKTGGGLVELAWASLAMNLLGHALSWWYAHRLLPKLRYGAAFVSREYFGLIGSYSSVAFLGALAMSIAFQTDSLVITRMLGAALVTPFAIASGLVENARSLVHSATFVLSPTASEMEAKGEADRLHDLLITGSKYSVLVSWPVLFGLCFFGDAFLRAWVGADLARAAFPVLLTLTLPTFLSLPEATASALLFGVSRHRGVVALSLTNALLNLALSVWWAKPLGIVGVALGTAVPLVLVAGVATMVYACRALALPIRRYAWEGLVQPGLVGAAFVPPALALRFLWRPEGWVPVLAACALCWLAFAFVAWRYGIGPRERGRWGRALAGLFGRAPAAVGGA